MNNWNATFIYKLSIFSLKPTLTPRHAVSGGQDPRVYAYSLARPCRLDKKKLKVNSTIGSFP